MRIGIAYSPNVERVIAAFGSAIDYVEIPFELLEHNRSAASVGRLKPLILHCASLSVAGTVRPPRSTVSAVKRWVQKTKTPWLGEHLSFTTADRQIAGDHADEYAPGQPYNIGFTVSPPMNAEAVERVLTTLNGYSATFGVPILLENPPLYFVLPGSTMSQVDFIREICRRSSVRLLLDVTHFAISASNIGFDPFDALKRLPLDRVTEIHISGFSSDSGTTWDDHAVAAPDIVLELLRLARRYANAEAVTLEYNWSADFDLAHIGEELSRVRRALQ